MKQTNPVWTRILRTATEALFKDIPPRGPSRDEGLRLLGKGVDPAEVAEATGLTVPECRHLLGQLRFQRRMLKAAAARRTGGLRGDPPGAGG